MAEGERPWYVALCIPELVIMRRDGKILNAPCAGINTDVIVIITAERVAFS